MLDTKKHNGWVAALCDPQPFIDDLIDCALRRSEAEHRSIIKVLVTELASRREKPILLNPIEMRGVEQFGCWLTDKDERFDFIFYESQTPTLHQEHIILHELSHIMLGHRTYRVGCPDEAIDLVLMRTNLRDSEEEQDAEYLATLIQAAILRKVGMGEMLRRAGDTGWSELFGGLRLDR